MKMHLFFSLFGIFIYTIHATSNYNQDYPNIKYCVIPDNHPQAADAYIYLKRQLGLDLGCTHIRGSLFIEGLTRYENGTDPDLSFLESIIEISGKLRIMDNSVRRIPLGNLTVIRGMTSMDTDYSLEISHNVKNESHFLEEIDLHSLRVIMSKNVRINLNYGLGYLVRKVNWNEILANATSQKSIIHDTVNNNKNANYTCHASCTSWPTNSSNYQQFCFGPRETECQPRSKCVSTKGASWCQFTDGGEVACDRECVGGCTSNLPESCVACRGLYKKDQCVNSCQAQQGILFGNYDRKVAEDKLIYTTGSLCTSQCPYSLLDQEKHCTYQCDYTKFYKSGNRCIECPNEQCYNKIGDQLMCDLLKLDPTNPNNGKKHSLNKATLLKMTNCTIIIGRLLIDDDSFKKQGVTIEMLYQHLKNVREVIGDLTIRLFIKDLRNLTFLSNLKEVRGTILSSYSVKSGLKVFVSSLEFLGLKRLEKVYGIVNMNHKSNLCYDDTIPWREITRDEFSEPRCNKTCDPLCTKGCWGPGNSFCYKCEFLKAGDLCVKNCSDATGYFAQAPLGSNGAEKRIQCGKCDPLCKDNCTGPSAKDCTSCRFAKENGTCVTSCSSTSYAVLSTTGGHTNCKPCHSTCYTGEILKTRKISSACTGPSNIIGPGGCYMCNKVIVKDNKSSCHKGSCPAGFFASKIKDSLNEWSVEQISCDKCNPLCDRCIDNGTKRDVCTNCKGYWSHNHCVKQCIENVKNVSRPVRLGDECPSCHRECRDGCLSENDNTTCIHCVNKKLFRDASWTKFTCETRCPQERNYTDYIHGNLVCLTLEETLHYQQKKRINIVIASSFTFLILSVIFLIVIFRWRFKQSKIKTELKAFYSNFNEPSMKNIKEDHVTRPPNMNRLQMIPISDLIFDTKSKPLGAGAFGKVFRGQWKVPGPDGKSYYLDVVVKVIHNASKSSTNEFLEEAQIMASVSHRHCLPLIGVCLSLEKPCLVSTFAKYGSLEKYLHQYSSKISSYTLLKWCEHIADGMAYLNLRGIIHRDLASRNILVNDKDIVQITDFGLARLVDDIDDGIVVQSGRVPIRWLAVETLLYATYSTASDVWAFGVTLWEIFTFGKRPYEEIDTSKIKSYLLEGNRLSQPDICTLEVYMVMIKCWLEDHQQRPSFTELMSTFDLFSRNSKRYLCIPREHQTEYSTSLDSNKEQICLTRFSTDSDFKQIPHFTNRSDDTSWNHMSNTDSAYHLIQQSYNKDDLEDHQHVLPMRKKPKRNISFDRFKGLHKIGLSKLLSGKSQDTKSFVYVPSNSFDSTRNSYLSNESTTALISHQRSSEYDGPPVNPQVAKLIKQESLQSARPPKPIHKHDSLRYQERIFNDKVTKDDGTRDIAKSIDQRPVNRSPSLPPNNIFRFVSVEPLILPPSLPDVEEKTVAHSPDSGNNQDFDADDYLVPSRVQSQGYYNLTPSPSATMKPTLEPSEAIVVHNDSYHQIVDDGYLEPTAKTAR